MRPMTYKAFRRSGLRDGMNSLPSAPVTQTIDGRRSMYSTCFLTPLAIYIWDMRRPTLSAM